MSLLIYSTETIGQGRSEVTLFHFVSQERDPNTGFRRWTDLLTEAQRYVDTDRAEQDRLLYGGVITDERDLQRLGMDVQTQAYGVAGYVPPFDTGWARLEPSPAPLELGL